MNTGAINLGSPVNRAAPLNRGLVSWWMTLPQMPRAARFLDLCGNYHGTLTNGPTWVTAVGRPGGYVAIDCDGSSSYVELDETISLGADLTLSAWINHRAAATDAVICIRRTMIEISYSQQFVWYPDIDRLAATYAAGFATGEWNHIAVTQLGTTYAMYVNGVNIKSGSSGFGLNNGVGGTAIGKYPISGGEIWDGQLDDIRYWNRSLSDTDVLAIYNDSRTGYQRTLNRLRRQMVSGAAAGNRRRQVLIGS